MEQAAKRSLAPASAESGERIKAPAKPAAGPSVADEMAASELRGEYALRYCPVCSQRLESRRCKLICNRCGYYMSCADYI